MLIVTSTTELLPVSLSFSQYFWTVGVLLHQARPFFSSSCCYPDKWNTPRTLLGVDQEWESGTHHHNNTHWLVGDFKNIFFTPLSEGSVFLGRWQECCESQTLIKSKRYPLQSQSIHASGEKFSFQHHCLIFVAPWLLTEFIYNNLRGRPHMQSQEIWAGSINERKQLVLNKSRVNFDSSKQQKFECEANNTRTLKANFLVYITL